VPATLDTAAWTLAATAITPRAHSTNEPDLDFDGDEDDLGEFDDEDDEWDDEEEDEDDDWEEEFDEEDEDIDDE
jgi:hypothetical protein